MALSAVFCRHAKKTLDNGFHKYQNIYWKILAFEDTTHNIQTNDILVLDAEFFTQHDSLFWNSHHEGNDAFFIQIKDSALHTFYHPFYLLSEYDSVCVYAPPSIVLSEIFNLDSLPYFLKNDSIVKCFIKIKKKYASLEFIKNSFQSHEKQIIKNFLLKNNPLYQTDEHQIIWLDPLPIPDKLNNMPIHEATLAYRGYFLDGRLIDFNDSLCIRYNDSLQILQGLNYVIKKLQIGQSAKIILPSQLAFGSKGSLNKTIPPYTPLLYEIKLIQIK